MTTSAARYRKLSDDELRAAIMERPNGKLPPPDEFKALTDEWIRRRQGSGYAGGTTNAPDRRSRGGSSR